MSFRVLSCCSVLCVYVFVSTLLVNTPPKKRDNSLDACFCAVSHQIFFRVSSEQSIKNAYQFLNLQQTKMLSLQRSLRATHSLSVQVFLMVTSDLTSHSVKYAHREKFFMQFSAKLLCMPLLDCNPFVLRCHRIFRRSTIIATVTNILQFLRHEFRHYGVT